MGPIFSKAHCCGELAAATALADGFETGGGGGSGGETAETRDPPPDLPPEHAITY
jgi:hypothetical protein